MAIKKNRCPTPPRASRPGPTPTAPTWTPWWMASRPKGKPRLPWGCPSRNCRSLQLACSSPSTRWTTRRSSAPPPSPCKQQDFVNTFHLLLAGLLDLPRARTRPSPVSSATRSWGPSYSTWSPPSSPPCPVLHGEEDQHAALPQGLGLDLAWTRCRSQHRGQRRPPGAPPRLCHVSELWGNLR